MKNYLQNLCLDVVLDAISSKVQQFCITLVCSTTNVKRKLVQRTGAYVDIQNTSVKLCIRLRLDSELDLY